MGPVEVLEHGVAVLSLAVHLLIRAVNLTEKKVRCACCISAVLPVYSSKLLTS